MRGQPDDTPIENNLRAARERSRVSAVELARQVGLSRQAIYAIEAGSYVPNTTVSLRLARALEVSVEELFRLPGAESEVGKKALTVSLFPRGAEVRVGEPVQLAQVDGRLIAIPSDLHRYYLPASDGILTGRTAASQQARVQVYGNGIGWESRLVIAGCDPATLILRRHLEAAGVSCVFVHCNSSESLSLLKRGYVHIAGTHLHEPGEAAADLSAVPRTFGKSRVLIVSFATWQQCLIVARGNPKRIRSVSDLARNDVRLVNREPGSGSRLVLEGLLRRADLPPRRIHGFDCLADGHLAAAREVLSGHADCCVAPEAAARLFGLSQVPLTEERYDFVVRRNGLNDPRIAKFFDVISAAGLGRELHNAAGYDMSLAGKRIL